VELLVAMVISLIVLGGVYQMFRESTATYRMQEGLSRIQENGRFAMYFLTKDVRQAGYLGCMANVPNFVNALNDTGFLYDFSVGLNGFEAQGTTWVPTRDPSIPATDLVRGSDIITVRGAIGSPVFIDRSMPTSSAVLKTASVPSGVDPPVETGDIVLISDCTANAAVFQITNYTPANGNLVRNTGGKFTPGNRTKDLGHKFQKGAKIIAVTTTSYFIRTNPSGHPALYKRVGASDSVEIVEGVETMQILYGIDTGGDKHVDTYVAANAVTNWNNVRSVQIGLLVRTINEIRDMEPDNATYNVLGTTFGPFNDRHLRRVFTTTIALRNRLP
jgi:type IV pilus assembly protein PilW